MKDTINITRHFLSEAAKEAYETENNTVKKLIKTIDSLDSEQLLDFWKSLEQYVDETDKEDEDWAIVKKSICKIANLFEKNLKNNQ